MKHLIALMTLGVVMAGASSSQAFYGDPPTERHAYGVHDSRRPQPPIITPGTFSTEEEPGTPPSDAIVLFDGTSLDLWEADDPRRTPLQWEIVEGALQPKRDSGYIRTKDGFGDCHLHIEFATPTRVEGSGQGRGNSGVFLMGIYEVQVLDSYDNPTYPDGMLGSVYGQQPPLVNAARKPGEWQTYDIVFRQPRFENGELAQAGYMTVFLNGVLVQDHWELEGPTTHIGRTRFRQHEEQMPLKLQDHGNPVRFRNIWIRPLPDRNFEMTGVSDDPEEVMAKRRELAAQVREEAAAIDHPMNRAYRLLASIQYEIDADALQEAESIFMAFLNEAEEGGEEKVVEQRDPIRNLRNQLRRMAGFNLVPDDYPPLAMSNRLVEEFDLDNRRR